MAKLDVLSVVNDIWVTGEGTLDLDMILADFTTTLQWQTRVALPTDVAVAEWSPLHICAARFLIQLQTNEVDQK